MTLLGFHLHSAPGDITVNTLLMWLHLMGGNAARLDTNWSDYQAPPQPASFNSAAAGLSDGRFRDYLMRRGYGAAGENLRPPLDNLRTAERNGVKPVFNFGIIRDWAMRPRADFPQTPAGQRQWENALADPASPGEFLHDFIVYAARQPDGLKAIANVAGWQMFNEVGGVYGERPEQLPRDDYFRIGERTLALVHDAYAAVDWKKAAAAAPPPVIMPSLGGAHDPLFFDAMFDYAVTDKAAANVEGGLAMEAVALHPYGARVEPWLDPVTDEELGDATKSNGIYHRLLRPTDDRLTWQSLVTRDAAQSKALGLAFFADAANPAEAWFDRNSEQGIEQTMAQLAQNGYGAARFHFTEWGNPTYRGNAAGGAESLWDTAFADPYKYGVITAGSLLPQPVAENLQAESVLQMLGLLESWDAVDTATVYEMFDQKAGEYEGEFGLARGLTATGQPDWKPAGLAYAAYLSGSEFHRVDIVSGEGNRGVDFHIAAKGSEGPFDEAKRDPAANELVLLREGSDRFDAGAGDDIAFGGAGDDELAGGDGYDRLYGGPGNDTLSGGSGADKLKGDEGDDTLSGGKGADHFVFAAYGISGSGFAGHDTITDFNPREDRLLITGGYRVADLFSSALYPRLAVDTDAGLRLTYADNGATILLQGVKRAALTPLNFHILQSDRTVAFGLTPDHKIEGTPTGDDLKGTPSDDLISGGRGADSMTGGNGNDTYVVDAPGDTVIETVQGGHDRIVTRVSIASLPDHVEDVLLDSWKPLDATGNVLANEIAGNNNRNTLRGEGGDDLLNGGPSRDTLDGGPGNDILSGGSGNDVFIVNGSEGDDVILDFATGDKLHIMPSTGFKARAEVRAALVQKGPDTVIDFPAGGKLVLQAITAAAINDDAIELP